MSLSHYKLTDAAIAQTGVIAAPDKLTGTAAQNKAIFDRLIRETVREIFNGLIDALAAAGGAAEIGTTDIDGVTGGNVQTVLGSLKSILDTKSASSDMAAALALKSDKSVTDLHFREVRLNAATGVLTFTREDGSFVTVDTVLEKVTTNWRYDAATQSLVLTLADGTTQSVPLGAFITETEFADSAQIAFSVRDHVVTATVRAGSITDTMLSSALIAQMQGYVAAAAEEAADAAQHMNAAGSFRTAAENSAAASANSASAAATGAAAATAAAAAVKNLGVASSTLPPGSLASVSKTVDQTGAVTLTFGIPRGETGAEGAAGPQGVQGLQGERGMNGVAVATSGSYAFNVNALGHLILSYTGTDAPDFSIDESGHLLLSI